MTARGEGLLLIGVMVVLSFVFQIQLKLFAMDVGALLARQDIGWSDRLWQAALSTIAWRPVLIAVLAVTIFGVYLMALTRLELSLALSLASVTLAANALAGGFLLGEAMTVMRIAGILVIAVGVAMVVRG